MGIDISNSEQEIQNSPESVGRDAMDVVVESLYRSRRTLKIAADHYLGTYQRYGEDGYTPEPGVGGVLATIRSDRDYAEGVVSGKASEKVIESAKKVDEIVGPLAGKLDEALKFQEVGGPTEEFRSELEAALKNLLIQKDIYPAGEIIQQINARIVAELNGTRDDSDFIKQESVKVEEEISEEDARFRGWKRDFVNNDPESKNNTMTVGHYGEALHRLAETTVANGEPLRNACDKTAEMLESSDQPWKLFAEAYIQTLASSEK